ncbi:MAG: serine hydrolase [Thermodesulfobacteriota bacterium]
MPWPSDVRRSCRPLLAAIVATVVVAPAGAEQLPPCATPAADADWAVSTPADAGFDARALCALLEAVATGKRNIHAVLVERRGRLVAELYRSGRDSPIDVLYGLGNPFAPDVRFGVDVLHDVRSVSKSVVGLLVGIALHDGRIASLSTPALDAFPELADLRTSGRHAITIEHLLTMSSGLDWDEWDAGPLTSDETRLLWKSDLVRFVFDRPLVAAPGSRFNYNGGGTATVAELLTRASDRSLPELAREQILAPLGITRWTWATDLHDRPLAFAGLRLRPRDMLKLGRLVLGRGRWRERQVVPEAWIDESLRPHAATGITLAGVAPEGAHYGYHWWTGRLAWRDRELAWGAAFGNGGQRILVVPDLDLGVVTTAGDYGSIDTAIAVNRLLAQIVATVADEPGAGGDGPP